MAVEFIQAIEHSKNRLEFAEIDLAEYEEEFSRTDRHYKLVFERKLDYKTKIACQTMITLVSDLNGKIINDIYDNNPNNKMQTLHVCVFPLEDSTEVLLFTDVNNMKYDNLQKQLSHHIKDWTYIINYMILLYCDDWAISSEFNSNPEVIDKLKDVISISQDMPINIIDKKTILKKACDLFKLKVNRKIYNFLLE